MSQLPRYIASARNGDNYVRLFHVGNYHYQIVSWSGDMVLDMPDTDFELACEYLNAYGDVVNVRL